MLLKEGKVDGTKGRMDYGRHNFFKSVEDEILTTCVRTKLRVEEREKKVENIASNGLYFLFQGQGYAQSKRKEMGLMN